VLPTVCIKFRDNSIDPKYSLFMFVMWRRWQQGKDSSLWTGTNKGQKISDLFEGSVLLEVQVVCDACAKWYYFQPHLSIVCLIRPMRPRHGRNDIMFVNESVPSAQDCFFCGICPLVLLHIDTDVRDTAKHKNVTSFFSECYIFGPVDHHQALKRKISPVTGLVCPRGFQEVKVPRFHDTGTGWR